MLKTIEEINDVEIDAGVVVNGVDNANLMSVDSTEPIKTKNEEEKISANDIDISKEVEKKEEKKEEKTEKKEEEKEEKIEKKKEKEEKKSDESTDSKGVQKRINQLTKKMRTAERENDFSRARVKELEKELEKFEFKTLKDEDKKPLKVDFEDEDDYIEALTDWKIDKKLGKTQQNAAKETRLKEEQDAVGETFKGLDNALEKGENKYDDFKELIMDKDLVIGSEVTQIILDTEIPEDIMYHFANNPEESERVSNLDPIRIAKEIGKLEISLKTVKKKEEKKEEKKKVKKQSNAPEPITPVKTDGVTEKDPEKMSPKEYKEWRSKEKE